MPDPYRKALMIAGAHHVSWVQASLPVQLMFTYEVRKVLNEPLPSPLPDAETLQQAIYALNEKEREENSVLGANTLAIIRYLRILAHVMNEEEKFKRVYTYFNLGGPRG